MQPIKPVVNLVMGVRGAVIPILGVCVFSILLPHYYSTVVVTVTATCHAAKSRRDVNLLNSGYTTTYHQAVLYDTTATNRFGGGTRRCAPCYTCGAGI